MLFERLLPQSLQTCPDVLVRQVWEVGKDVFDRHPTGEVLKNVPDCHTEATDARLPTPLTRLDRD